MRLINNKKQSSDVEKIIDCLNLKNQPYEIKEDAMSLVGALLPITVFCVSGEFLEMPEVMAMCALSFYPSIFMVLAGTQLAYKKHQNKVYKAKKTYDDFSNECVDFLSGEEKSKLLANVDKFENEPQIIEQMANRIKIANARRNAKFISKYDYKKQLDFLGLSK